MASAAIGKGPLGLVVRAGVPSAVQAGLKLVEWVAARGIELRVDEGTAYALGLDQVSYAHPQLAEQCEVLVTLGGDGTFLGLARYVNDRSPIMIGVNFGNLGFLTEIAPSEIFQILESVYANKAQLGMRSMLIASLVREGKEIFNSQALNEAVIQKEARDRLLDIQLSVNSHDVMRLRADGLIVATPAGSTAYSLAAGGSIVHPSLDVLVVTPICPHSLTIRPLILSLNDKLIAKIPEYLGNVVLTIDGQVSMPLRSGDEVHVTRSPHVVRLVESPSRNYFEILRTKLNWGAANKPG